jgi:acetylornithine deacetylase/succinyl-diaminopimelate desuccinylase-like protein
MVSLKSIYGFVEDNSRSLLDEFRQFIRQPGISTEDSGIQATVDWLVAKMKENGIADVQVFQTARHPIILGKIDGRKAERTLLVYGHYDVQPPGDRHDWKADPFAAEIVDGQIIGRGTSDMKNNLMACVHAVKAIHETGKSLPLNLIYLFEGEEEIGSPSLKPFIEQHLQELSKCDAILCGDGGGENKTGENLIMYGLKGMLFLELSVKSPDDREIHSMYAGVIENPAWRLISALMTLKQGNQVVIPHFYDGAEEPSIGEKMKYGLARFAMKRESLEGSFGFTLKKDMTVSTALTEVFYKPTLNINGLWSGYTVRGGLKTIVPDSAYVHLDIRTVPGQDTALIFESLKDYLKSKGFADVTVEKLGFDLPGYKIDSGERIAKVVEQATKALSKKTTTIPIMPGSGAMAWLPHVLRKPMAFAGSGVVYMAHSANEFITPEQYLKGIKLFATIYNDYAS